MNCPLPRYYFCHAAVSLIIAIAIAPVLGISAGCAAGIAFYAGREFTQWESGLTFDWKGILAPVIACSLAWGVAKWL